MATPVSNWFLYALGGGLGHLTRCVALARAAGRRGVACTILTNSPFADCLPVREELTSDDRLIVIPPDRNRDATAAEVRAQLRETPFDLLVVDTFPRGLGGELVGILPLLRVPRVLVHRDLNPEYVERYQLASFVRNYEALLLPGESAALESVRPSLRTNSWLIRDADELRPRSEARRALAGDCVDDLPIVLIIGSGRADEIEEMRQISGRLQDELSSTARFRFVAPGERLDSQFSWPAFRFIAGVDVIIGAGGCNTVSEARATETPLLALARPRLYDRQAVRLKSSERVSSFEELRDRLTAILARQEPERNPFGFQNGTAAAVTYLLNLQRAASDDSSQL